MGFRSKITAALLAISICTGTFAQAEVVKRKVAIQKQAKAGKKHKKRLTAQQARKLRNKSIKEGKKHEMEARRREFQQMQEAQRREMMQMQQIQGQGKQVPQKN